MPHSSPPPNFTPNPEDLAILNNLRAIMDDEDEQLVGQIAYRYFLAEQILDVKKRLGIPLHSPDREHRILTRVTRLAADLNVPAGFIQMLYYQLLGHPFRKFEPICDLFDPTTLHHRPYPAARDDRRVVVVRGDEDPRMS